MTTLTYGKSTFGIEALTKGSWHCMCSLEAVRRSVTDKSKPSLDWRCRKPKGAECNFFVWSEDEAGVKAQLGIPPEPQTPQTPTRTGARSAAPGAAAVAAADDRGNPFTLSRKRPSNTMAYRGDADDNDSSRPSNQRDLSAMPTDVMALGDPFSHPRQLPNHTREFASPTAVATPGPFAKRLKGAAAFPTPPSNGRTPTETSTAYRLRAPPPSQAFDASPTPARFREGTSFDVLEEADWGTKLLELLRAGGVELRGTPAMVLRHEVNMLQDMSQARLRRYEKNIEELRERVQELEETVPQPG